MAKASKFAALAELREEQDAEAGTLVEAAAPVVDAPTAPPPQAEPRGRGRPPGKRSDPDWKLYSHFLKRKTQREAAALLLERDDGRDLSDVLQMLLDRWLTTEKRRGA